MKSYTDITQSKKLIELGIDVNTADMWWNTEKHYPEFVKTYREHLGEQISPIPVWSLAALIEAMPEILIETVKAQDGYDGYYYFVTYEDLIGVPYKKELIDACYEMILRLHEEELI